MALITPDTFDPLRRFVSVRLQQGVPIVDADWNEGEDMRRFELRAYLKWFVGDGVPFGTDAFRVAARAVPVANDVDLLAGTPPAPPGTSNYLAGLRHVGRCLVEGAEATIAADLAFRAQELHASQPGAAALAVQRGVPVIDEMPALDGTACLYLDLWDRLVRPDEMPALVFADIGTESCARLRSEWVVRARAGGTAPQPGDPDHLAGHAYYALARVTRIAADPVVYPSQVEDLREQRLLTPPAHLIEDLLGSTPDRYRRGLDRPAMPLRDVVNALLRGELPGTPDQAIAPDPAADFATRAIAHTGTATVLAWHSTRVAAANRVFVTTWPDADPALAGTTPPVQVTALDASTPALVLLPTLPAPSPLVAYTTQNDVRFRRAASLGGLPAAAETPVAATADIETQPLALLTGSVVTFLWHRNGPALADTIRYRRRQYDATWAEAAAAWLEADTVDLSPLRPAATAAEPWGLHAATDALGRIYAAFRTATDDIAPVRLTPATGARDTWGDLQLSSGTADEHPFVLVEGPARVWLFWRADGGIFASILDVALDAWGPPALIPGTDGPAGDNERPAALLDADGGIWLFWARDTAGKTDVWTTFRNAATGAWGSPRQVTGSAGNNDFPVAVARGGAIDLLVRSNRAGNFDLFAKRLVTRI